MDVEIRINGSAKLPLIPTTPLETLVIGTMLDLAKRGVRVVMEADGDVAVIAVQELVK